MSSPDSTNSPPLPFGFCECGCGQQTRLDRNGRPRRYLKGHHGRKPHADYLVEDQGFTSACWIWQRQTNGVGYPVVGSRSNRKYVHRLYYEEARGPIPHGLSLDHLCSVSLCVNPDHLQPVTHTENVQRGKGAKLTPTQVQEIRMLCAKGRSPMKLAAQFGVHKNTIHSIARKASWQNI